MPVLLMAAPASASTKAPLASASSSRNMLLTPENCPSLALNVLSFTADLD